ncbi:hypothetical protein FJM67_02245 [Maribrevibacterium harenarium]|uniref:Esterase n=1 Tax=Maribrevibacterium harenarium TaxID=2589817 RepID=A0A501X397_9GAMM|nr:YqiA/YcfP family alpha/beta fold hydrolase [Maribrevibacterium harenarium]TPE54897.1 hypothetical protein FJM67_02245 [Maribrevibacterium harenarium]
MPFLIYVHGFNSSERSFKSQRVKQALEQRGLGQCFACPRLDWQPQVAIQQLCELIEAKQQDTESVTLIGSSLGGFYSTYLSERYQLPAILVNPAVAAPVLLRDYLGEQKNPYTGERYVLTERHMQQLELLDIATPTQSRYWLMVQEGDEVLDYRAALKRFPTPAKLTHEPDGDHSFVGFERFVDDILRFAGF